MNQFATLASLAVVGYAETATFETKDFFGNALTSTSVEYTPGQTYSAVIDLGVSTETLKELQINSGAYGVNECRFLMKPQTKGHKEKMGAHDLIEVGHFDTQCKWPNIQTGDSTVYKLDVQNIPQFYSPVHLFMECDSQDVTLDATKADSGCTNFDLVDTVENNQLENPTGDFYFGKLYRQPAQLTMQMATIYTSNFAKIFLGGMNPALDVLFNAVNLCAYKQSAKDLFRANGILPLKGHQLMNHKEGHKVTPEQIELMAWGVEYFGMSIYGIETLGAIHPFWTAFKESGLDGVNALIFQNLDYGNSNFGMVLNGDLTFNQDFWKEVEFYFYAHAAIMEILAVVMAIQFEDTTWIVNSWPRTANALWEFGLAFHE